MAALAAQLKLNVCVLTLSSQHINDAIVNQLLVEAPINAMILLEDVDVAFPSREEKEVTVNMPYTYASPPCCFFVEASLILTRRLLDSDAEITK